MYRYPLLPALLWALFILVLCLMPGQALPTWEWADLLSLDKPVHAILFGVFFVLLTTGLRRQQRWPFLREQAMVVAITVAVAYGALTELLQELPMLGRRGDLLDLAANAFGTLLGVVYLRWREARGAKREGRKAVRGRPGR